MAEILVSDIERVEAQRSSPLVAVLEAAGIKVRRDQLDRPTVSLDDAKRWLDEQAEAGARAIAEATRLQEIQASLNRGEAPRDPESRVVFEKAYAKAQRKGHGDGYAAHVAAAAVRHKVLGMAEEEEPEPRFFSFEGFDKDGAVVSEVH